MPIAGCFCPSRTVFRFKKTMKRKVNALNETSHGASPPWSRQDSLRKMAEDAGADFDRLIAGLAAGWDETALSQGLGIGPAAAAALKDHFYQYGVNSIMEGQP
jgi:hypothetical protein